MSNRRTPADVNQTRTAKPSSGSGEQVQDNQPLAQGHSLSSSSASFNQSTSAPANTGDQQWFPASQQMIVTSSSFYDPTQASGFTPQQPTVNVWDAQFIGPGGEYFPRQNTSYQQPYRFEGAGTSQYSFAQDQVQQQNSQPRPLMHTARRSARGSAQPSGYYRQGGAQSQQYSQAPSVPSNPPSTQPPPPQPSQQPTSQILAAQRTTQLIAGQFPLVQAE